MERRQETPSFALPAKLEKLLSQIKGAFEVQRRLPGLLRRLKRTKG
jgi:hypothetical protein